MRHWTRTFGCTLVLGAALASASAEVYVVGPAQPGVDFTSLGTAIALAAEGDTLLVLPAPQEYAPAQIQGKSLDLVALEGKPTILSLTVRDLAPTQRVRVVGFHLISYSPLVPGLSIPPMRSIANAGLLQVQDCTLDFGFFTKPDDAMTVEDSSHVVLARCSLTGHDGETNPHASAGHGLQVAGSSVWLHGCQLAGGNAKGEEDELLASAGSGIDATDSSIHAFGCTCTGGMGAFSVHFDVFGGFTYLSTPGAPGVALDDSALEFQDCVVKAGRKYWEPAGTPNIEVAGASSATLLPGRALLLDVASSKVEGDSVQARITGEPGTAMLLLAGNAATPAVLPGIAGELLVGPPLFAVPLGALPASGTLDVAGTLGPLPAGVDAASIALQIAGAGASGAGWSSPRLLVVLDAAL